MFSNSDGFAECSTKGEAIRCYLKRLNGIKAIAKREYGIESNEFAEMFEHEFHSNEPMCTTPIPNK